MSRRMMVSTLAAVVLLAVVALGQQPDKKPVPGPDGGATKTDPTDAAVKAALANDPDVQVARAKIMLAEAELAKAKQGVVLKVLTLKATIQEHKAAVVAAEQRIAPYANNPSVVPLSQAREDRLKLETAKAALQRAEMELKLLTGGGKEMGMEGPSRTGDLATQHGALWLSRQALIDHSLEASESFTTARALAALYMTGAKTPVGAVPERIRAALDKPVRLGQKGEKVTFEKALDVFKKEAGLDVPMRGPREEVGTIISDGEELPVGAWFQLFEDQTVPKLNQFAKPHKARFYVREYGVLLAMSDEAPPDAPTLTEFWKQKLQMKAKEVHDPIQKPEK